MRLWLAAMLAWCLAAPASAQEVHRALTDVACTHCHEDPHPVEGKPCVECHALEAWVPSTFTLADHRSTSFPLEGRHTDAACSGCHIGARLTGLPTECAGCHVDRHRGKLGDDCTACHSVQGFRPVPEFDHDLRTSFSLTGHHKGVSCTACHEGSNGMSMRMVMEPTCVTCHQRGHGAFGSPCETCHESEDATFPVARKGFDHRPTSFPLERRHKNLPCKSCHSVGQTRPPQPQCRSCHTDQHAGQLGTTCSDCHRPDRWNLVRFDHDQSGWALRGRHFVTPCGQCHTANRWIGLRTECYTCHQPDLVRAPIMVPAHANPLSSCDDCHGLWSWGL